MHKNVKHRLSKKLRRFYEKELRKAEATDVGTCSDYFYLALRYFRDKHILAVPLDFDLSKDPDFVSLCTAISEYESYYNCVVDYYDMGEDGEPIQKNAELSPEDVSAQYKAERALHWGFFWEFVKNNLDKWEDLMYDFEVQER